MTEVRIVWDQQALHQLLEGPQGPVAKYLLRLVLRIEALAKRLCAVDTGRLRSSITHDLGVDGRGLYGMVGTNVEYAIFLEFGTRHMRARPFLRPALRAAA